jgi:CheY-like chemotaxis protein
LKGWHFLTLVRLDRQLCRVPLVLCTAAVTTVEPMRANLAAQQVRIVYKPFDIETLLAEIDAAALGLPVPLAVDVPMAD